MDFKSLIQKIDSMDTPVELPKAPKAADPIRLDEDTELRVLAGITPLTESVIAEKAVSKSQQQAAGAALAAKRGDTPKSKLKGASKEMMSMSVKELEKFAGTKHKGLPKKKTDESVDEKVDEAKFEKSGVRATSNKKGEVEKSTRKQYFVKLEKEGKMKGVTMVADEGESEGELRDRAKRENMGWTVASVRVKSDESVSEAAKPDFLDMDKDGDKKEPMKKAVADKGGDKKDSDKKGMSAKQEKYFGKKNESKMMPKGKKRPVKESVEPTMTFKDLLKIVQESGGAKQIDPVDAQLWNWAQRVAAAKFDESLKQQLYSGIVYERMGGKFEMFDALNENQE